MKRAETFGCLDAPVPFFPAFISYSAYYVKSQAMARAFIFSRLILHGWSFEYCLSFFWTFGEYLCILYISLGTYFIYCDMIWHGILYLVIIKFCSVTHVCRQLVYMAFGLLFHFGLIVRNGINSQIRCCVLKQLFSYFQFGFVSDIILLFVHVSDREIMMSDKYVRFYNENEKYNKNDDWCCLLINK